MRSLLEHEPQVRAFLRGLLPSWNDVDEVLQEASLVAWRKFPEFQQGTAFGGWFLTIARFEALKYRRRIARTPLVFADDVWDLLAVEASEAETQPMYRQHLEKCLAKMPADKRDLLLKVHSAGVVMRDIAIQSGKREQAFYKVIQRLRATLIECISKSISIENV
ncbi:RNA polymerase, sigma-24 subunit, ECF subfamily [Rhodopirellula maiorica SM1]|uniref:RNA polymerase, sigma-24 subunit, ECF subfamily n=1 Tax=Rhodopirellula maiorica SM1 TaxID=1265738 RepID=M5RP24_9BACT|nr:RNA polymerase, sigma-24 subunit, ECF subfamily [Rhodopirellula maiorica SM1]